MGMTFVFFPQIKGIKRIDWGEAKVIKKYLLAGLFVLTNV
jgi:hypothetical protein